MFGTIGSNIRLQKAPISGSRGCLLRCQGVPIQVPKVPIQVPVGASTTPNDWPGAMGAISAAGNAESDRAIGLAF
jgi:hypothetical protein